MKNISFQTLQDPLQPDYREAFIENPEHTEHLESRRTALLCIDLQYLDAAEGCGVFKNAEAAGVPEAARRYYFQTLHDYVLPNVRQLQETFREHQLEVIHVRIQSLTRDGRDRSKGHKNLSLLAIPGSREAEFLPEVAPEGDEIVVNKTASGVFSSTNLHYVLNNMGIDALYIAGVYTNECVETTVRAACDLGYMVTLVQDACTTVTRELHEASLATLRNRYARILNTDETCREIATRLPRRKTPNG
jgi:nicotinamidase-related amidase